MIYSSNNRGDDKMSDMEKEGLVGKGDVRTVVVKVIDVMREKEPDLLDLYAKGLKVMLTSNGLYLTDRREVGNLKKNEGIYTIIEVLTVEELYHYMVVYYQYIKKGQSYAVIQIMEYKLREIMDDVYEDNCDLIYKNLEVKQKQMENQSGGEVEDVSWNKWENAVW